MNLNYPELANVCFSASGYKGEREADNKYLGFDNFLEVSPKVDLEAMFKTTGDVEGFMTWWKTEAKRGKETFLIVATLFGTNGTYGIRQISPIVHTVNPHKIRFKAEILFDADSVTNNPPTATEISVFVDENTQDNFITLKGDDIDNDPLTYSIVTEPTKGTIAGTPPNLFYTPDDGYIGPDSFTFRVFDRWVESQAGTVTISVGEIAKADFSIEYIVTAPLRISGNFHYDTGNGIIIRGTGGYVAPETDTITIYSNDHSIDDRDTALITGATVNKWGNREDLSSLFKNMSNLTALSISVTAGICEGTNFSGMFWSSALQYLPVFDTSKGTNFSDMFRECGIKSIPSFDFGEGIYFQRMFKDSLTEVLRAVNSTKGQYFQDIFNGATFLECLGGIDTRNKINTGGMFTGATSLVNPVRNDRTILEGGAIWTNPTPCKMSVNGIIENTVATCDISTVGGSCTSSTTYTVDYENEASTPSFVWTVSGGTITAGQGTATVTVARTSSASGTLYLGCTVNDGTDAIYTGTIAFNHNRTFSYLTLDIPKQYSQLNLRSYINANNPQNKTEILLLNTRTNCSMTTGNLTGLNVEFRNTGELQGLGTSGNAIYSTNNGLNITSAIKLINTGAIRGVGGYGGTGGKGANNTYTTNHTERETPYWTGGGSVDRVCWSSNHFSWKGKMITVNRASNLSRLPIGYGPMTIGGVPNIYKGAYYSTGKESTSGDRCDGTTIYMHYTERRYSVTHSRTGGAGGTKGRGAGYGVTRTNGGAGSASSPSGGYSGGKGGNGGNWGVNGSAGGRGGGSGTLGTAGKTAGKAIVGSSHLVAGSVIGTVSGAVS